MNNLIMALLIGVCGVNSQVHQARMNILAEQNTRQYSADGSMFSTYGEFFFINNFDVTEQLGFTEWHQVLSNYEYFASHNFHVNFYRDDGYGDVIRKSGLVTGYTLKDIKSYDHNLEQNDMERVRFWVGVFSQMTYCPIVKSWLTETIPYYRICNVFLEYGLSSKKLTIDIILQRYVKNGHLMLRAVYGVTISSSASQARATVEINTGDYAVLYNYD